MVESYTCKKWWSPIPVVFLCSMGSVGLIRSDQATILHITKLDFRSMIPKKLDVRDRKKRDTIHDTAGLSFLVEITFPIKGA